jgi:hypothetical protein
MMICLRAWACCCFEQMRATTARRCARVIARKSLMFMGGARCARRAAVMLAVSKRARRKGRFGDSVNGNILPLSDRISQLLSPHNDITHQRQRERLQSYWPLAY